MSVLGTKLPIRMSAVRSLSGVNRTSSGRRDLAENDPGADIAILQRFPVEGEVVEHLRTENDLRPKPARG
jgi:hypothetical protein